MIRDIGRNLLWGVTAGLFFAACYTLYVTVLLALHGSAPFAAVNSTYARVVSSYVGTGIAAGAIVGLLRPLLRWRAGAVAVGIIAAFAVFAGFALADQGGFTRWHRETWLTCVICAVFFGPVVGLIRWTRTRVTSNG
jgi:hypothetical protein